MTLCKSLSIASILCSFAFFSIYAVEQKSLLLITLACVMIPAGVTFTTEVIDKMEY